MRAAVSSFFSVASIVTLQIKKGTNIGQVVVGGRRDGGTDRLIDGHETHQLESDEKIFANDR